MNRCHGTKLKLLRRTKACSYLVKEIHFRQENKEQRWGTVCQPNHLDCCSHKQLPQFLSNGFFWEFKVKTSRGPKFFIPGLVQIAKRGFQGHNPLFVCNCLSLNDICILLFTQEKLGGKIVWFIFTLFVQCCPVHFTAWQ